MRQINVGGELRNLVVEHKRNKRMYLRVKDDGTLFVTCPRYVSEQEILSFIFEKEEWILKGSKKERKRRYILVFSAWFNRPRDIYFRPYPQAY